MNTTTFPATLSSRRFRFAPAHLLNRVVARLAAAWRAASAQREFEALDETALRDLGIGHGELASFHAESQRRVESTRLRVAPLNDRWMAV